MQLSHLHITHFKRLAELSLSFMAEDDRPRPITLILGDNGSGKTTLLQAIALVLGLATRKLNAPGDLRWPGFLPERMSTRGATRIELGVVFDTAELETTRDLYTHWAQRARPELANSIAAPSALPRVTLAYQDGALSCAEGPQAMSQFLGRYFIKYLIRTDPALRRRFLDLGDVFWFDQNRNLASMEDLRAFLVSWWSYHVSPRRPDGIDFLGQLEGHLVKVFPGARFVGTQPMSFEGTAEPTSYVLLERDGLTYDIAEMSSGEQAVLPILYEFVRQSVARSVVLLDELELHLHPPEQQALLAALRKIGPDCQFFVTTHSPYLESVTPPEEEVRLEGGQRCL
jgi:predicted ATPase